LKVVGLTGGIGSGKSTVAGFFVELGVPVYIADLEAKRLTNTSKVIRKKIIALLGKDAYDKDGISRIFVADKIFNDKSILKRVNKIIHPKVALHFQRWMLKQTAPYCIKEAAILFENGNYKNCDYIILVTAPTPIRIKRVLKRDMTTEFEIENRISNQWDDEKKIPLADFQIDNIDLEATRSKVKELHLRFLEG